MLSSTGNDVEPGANGFRVSRTPDNGLTENGPAALRHYQQYGDETIQRFSRSSSSSGHLLRDDQDDDQQHDDSSRGIHGGTPLSQIGAHHGASVNDMYLGQGKLY